LIEEIEIHTIPINKTQDETGVMGCRYSDEKFSHTLNIYNIFLLNFMLLDLFNINNV